MYADVYQQCGGTARFRELPAGHSAAPCAQRHFGVEAYNRIKRGFAFLPNGQRHLRDLSNALGATSAATTERCCGPNEQCSTAPSAGTSSRSRAARAKFSQITASQQNSVSPASISWVAVNWLC
jgi:hypothetical protein